MAKKNVNLDDLALTDKQLDEVSGGAAVVVGNNFEEIKVTFKRTGISYPTLQR